MAQKHLHELLKEDQEPFLLKNYIAEKTSFLKKNPSTSKPHLHITKQTNFSRDLCKNACFKFSFNQLSPDLKKTSPLFEFHSPATSPGTKNFNRVFFHVPAKTAVLLVEAALRIHTHRINHNNKSQSKTGFGIFRSFFKGLSHRSRTRKGGIEADHARSEMCEKLFSCSCSRSEFWSDQRNEEKSTMDLETTCSFTAHSVSDDEEITEKTAFSFFDSDYRQSPFRFVLEQRSSPDCRTTEFSSPDTSPTRSRGQTKEKINDDMESLKKLQAEEEEEEEEEEKEQCSPVSVLDPPFQDDDEDQVDNDGYDVENNYVILQKAKQQLSSKHRRFADQVANLDPIKLDMNMLEEEFEKYDMKRLVLDLITEEEGRDYDDREEAVKRIYEKLDAWKEVELDTINMMVEQDLKREIDCWKKHKEEVGDIAIRMEVAILRDLLEELGNELVCF